MWSTRSQMGQASITLRPNPTTDSNRPSSSLILKPVTVSPYSDRPPSQAFSLFSRSHSLRPISSPCSGVKWLRTIVYLATTYNRMCSRPPLPDPPSPRQVRSLPSQASTRPTILVRPRLTILQWSLEFNLMERARILQMNNLAQGLSRKSRAQWQPYSCLKTSKSRSSPLHRHNLGQLTQICISIRKTRGSIT